jgi:hypothetical protein
VATSATLAEVLDDVSNLLSSAASFKDNHLELWTADFASFSTHLAALSGLADQAITRLDDLIAQTRNLEGFSKTIQASRLQLVRLQESLQSWIAALAAELVEEKVPVEADTSAAAESTSENSFEDTCENSSGSGKDDMCASLSRERVFYFNPAQLDGETNVTLPSGPPPSFDSRRRLLSNPKGSEDDATECSLNVH